jgi:hypothetical protein
MGFSYALYAKSAALYRPAHTKLLIVQEAPPATFPNEGPAMLWRPGPFNKLIQLCKPLVSDLGSRR